MFSKANPAAYTEEAIAASQVQAKHAHGDANGASNGHTDGAGNSPEASSSGSEDLGPPANGASNGHSNGDANGHANGKHSGPVRTQLLHGCCLLPRLRSSQCPLEARRWAQPCSPRLWLSVAMHAL